MFSGIVETTAQIVTVEEKRQMLQIQVEKPAFFDDLHIGDSICVDGICLTVEAFNETTMQFALAAETLKITGWIPSQLLNKSVNLERSLKLNDRIHGHLVTGHVDGVGHITARESAGEAQIFRLDLPEAVARLVWPKGSVALNGVSLTINGVQGHEVEVCLIPETLKRTNLGDLRVGDAIHVEGDYLAKALLRSIELSDALKGANR